MHQNLVLSALLVPKSVSAPEILELVALADLREAIPAKKALVKRYSGMGPPMFKSIFRHYEERG